MHGYAPITPPDGQGLAGGEAALRHTRIIGEVRNTMREGPRSSLSSLTAGDADLDDSDPAELLRGLDRFLAQRAADIEDELRQVSKVRKLIARRLSQSDGPPDAGLPPAGAGGANVGQTI